MRGRLFLVCMMVAVAIAACAGPALVGGSDDGRESEPVMDNSGASADDASAGDDPSGSDGEPAAMPNLSDSEEPADIQGTGTQDQSDTSPSRVTSTIGQKTPPSDPAVPPASAATVPPSVATSDLVVKAKADLAQRLGIDPEAIEVVSVQEVDWPDTSLGCPQPGMAYAQVLVSGSLVVLKVNGTSYEYHSASGDDPFYCAAPTPPAPPGYGDT